MDDSLETWLHELEMDDPYKSLFPELSSMMYDSSCSSGVEVEITKKQKDSDDHELAEKLYDENYDQTNNSIVFSTVPNPKEMEPLSFQHFNNGDYSNNKDFANTNDLHFQEIKPAMNWIEFDGQLGGDTWKNKVTTLPLPHHIVVERKRRQDLNHRFLDLSKVIPGKKKASILGDAVNYMIDLQERIKKLEDKSKKKVVESVVFKHKRSSSSNDDNFSNGKSRALQEIEAKVIETEKSVLIRVHCENNVKSKAILPTLLTQIPKLHLLVLTTNVVPFGIHTDITLIAQMEADFCMKTKDIVEYLRFHLN
ncbi:transcription factor bHLH18-like [Senna tora]|uniref:Transcription factor bHLH18-like n=1 Tax=Senna tora TaxID=362788 RepID=A0A834THV4_9FABA|nr:transcription factor bHLH18-like [Senna tora]